MAADVRPSEPEFVTDAFRAHASVEAIDAEIQAKRKKRTRLDGEIAALTVLKHQREQQIREGTWPTS